MERIFRNRLRKLLENRIKGKVGVHIYDDTLIIDIESFDGSIVWRYTMANIAVQMSVGLSTKIVADVILKQYKAYILSNYFYKNN